MKEMTQGPGSTHKLPLHSAIPETLSHPHTFEANQSQPLHWEQTQIPPHVLTYFFSIQDRNRRYRDASLPQMDIEHLPIYQRLRPYQKKALTRAMQDRSTQELKNAGRRYLGILAKYFIVIEDKIHNAVFKDRPRNTPNLITATTQEGDLGMLAEEQIPALEKLHRHFFIHADKEQFAGGCKNFKPVTAIGRLIRDWLTRDQGGGRGGVFGGLLAGKGRISLVQQILVQQLVNKKKAEVKGIEMVKVIPWSNPSEDKRRMVFDPRIMSKFCANLANNKLAPKPLVN